MTRWLCHWFGHRYVHGSVYAPRFYTCTRCGEPGFWVTS